MDFIRNFVNSFVKSLYDWRWLGAQRKNKPQAWVYFLSLIFLFTVLLNVHWLWTVPKQMDTAWQDFRGNIPEFSAQFKDGTLNIDELPQPYIFEGDDSDNNLIVYIDTKSTSTLAYSDILANRPGLILTGKELVVSDEQGRINSYAYNQEDDDWTMTRQELLDKVDRFVNSLLYILIPIVLLAGFVLVTIGKLLHILFVALLVWVVVLFAKKKYSFGEVFVVGLYAVTLPTVLSKLITSFGFYVPMLYSAILFGWLLWSLLSVKENTVEDEIKTTE